MKAKKQHKCKNIVEYRQTLWGFCPQSANRFNIHQRVAVYFNSAEWNRIKHGRAE